MNASNQVFIPLLVCAGKTLSWGTMEWLEKLKELVQDPSKRGRIKPILLEKSKEYRDAIFDDDDKAVEASLLSLIEPTPGTTVSCEDLSSPDVTFSVRNQMSKPVYRLPRCEELSDYIQQAPAEDLRFLVPPSWFLKLPDQNRNDLFRPALNGEVCLKIMWILQRLIEPPVASESEDTFHHLWDSLINDFLKFFSGENSWEHVRNYCGEGTTGVKRPDLVAWVGTYALWRGEEKGPKTPGNPEEELVENLLWTYGSSIPYVLAYHARAHVVTFCTLFQDERGEPRRKDLKVFHLDNLSSRVALFLACRNIARLFSTLEALCHSGKVESDIIPEPRRPSGKLIQIYGRKVVKLIPLTSYQRVLSNYNSIRGCPNTEVLLHSADVHGRLVFRRGLMQGPASLLQLIDCLRCICSALEWLHAHKFMHRDVRWPNVMRDLASENVWRLLDFDDMEQSPCSIPSELEPSTHAPEMELSTHDEKVDIWGVGHLLNTTGVLLPDRLRKLKDLCLSVDPNSRPSAKELLRDL